MQDILLSPQAHLMGLDFYHDQFHCVLKSVKFRSSSCCIHGGDGDSTFIVFGRLKTFDGDDEN